MLEKCVQMGTHGPEGKLKTAQILLPVCVTSCSITPTEVSTGERMRGFLIPNVTI